MKDNKLLVENNADQKRMEQHLQTTLKKNLAQKSISSEIISLNIFLKDFIRHMHAPKDLNYKKRKWNSSGRKKINIDTNPDVKRRMRSIENGKYRHNTTSILFLVDLKYYDYLKQNSLKLIVEVTTYWNKMYINNITKASMRQRMEAYYYKLL